MRILMVAPQPFFRPRGTPFSVLHRIRALTRLGHTVELVTYPFGESPTITGLTLHRTARPPLVSDVGIGPSVAKLFLDVPLFATAYRLARSGRFDLLHTHEEAGLLGSWIQRSTGLPHLYDMHSSLPQQFANFARFNWSPVVSAFRRIERYTLGGADAVIAICPELKDHVLASGYAGPVALIENTLDFPVPSIEQSQIAALREQLEIGDAPVVLYTGTLESYQGLELLIGAAQEVAREQSDVRFVLVGGTPEQIGTLRQQTHERGVEPAFRFVPAVAPTDVFLYHQMADVLVTTRSKGTNTPLKIYQYLRAGRPIVATAIRSHTQVLDGHTAELVQPDAAAIGAGLLRVIRDPKRGRALASAAATLARDRYSEDAYMRTLEGLIGRFTPRLSEAAVA
jgi:glycosyltransferase involved in cell wall biosynthesis